MPTPSLWKITSEGHGPIGEQIVNIYYFRQETENVFAGVDIAAAFDATIMPAILAALTNGYTHDVTRADCVGGFNNGVTGESFGETGHTGTHSGTSGSVILCGILKKLSAFSGRANRGRNFYSPMSTVTFDANGRFIASTTDLESVGAALIAGISPGAEPEAWLCQVSPSGFPGAVKDMTDYSVSAYCGVQRRRRGPGA